MFSIREVEYVLAINKYKSISKAAKICNVSQPALSIQINKLEDVLGFKIFERAKNNFILSPKGRQLIQLFEEIFARYKKVKLIGETKAQIKIGIIPTISPYLLPKIAKKLAKLDYKIYFFEHKTSESLKLLEEGELDFVVLAYYPKIIPQDYIYKKLFDEEFFFTTAKNTHISIEKGLNSEKIILLEEGNCINESIEGICQISPNKSSFAATSIEVVKAMIAGNNGYGILPKLSLNNNDNFNVKAFNPPKYRQIGLCCRPNFADKNLVKEIADLLSLGKC